LNKVKDLVGGWGNLFKIAALGIAAVIAGPLLSAIVSATLAVAGLSAKLVVLAARLGGALIKSAWALVQVLTAGVYIAIRALIPYVVSLSAALLTLAARAGASLVLSLTGLGAAFTGLTFSGGLAGVVAGIKAVGAALLALAFNPVVLGITAIAASAYLVYDNWKPISKFFSDMWNKITNAASRVGDSLRTTLTSWIDPVIAKYNQFVTKAVSILNMIPGVNISAPTIDTAPAPGTNKPAQQGDNGPLSSSGGPSNVLPFPRPLVSKSAQPETKVAVTFTDQRTLTKVSSNGPVKTSVKGAEMMASNNVGQNRRGNQRAV
jgi:hypothetical protein